MSQIQEKHVAAMDLAEAAMVAKLRGDLERLSILTRQAFENELAAAELIVNQLDAEPTRSILHRSAATLAIDILMSWINFLLHPTSRGRILLPGKFWGRC